MHRLRILLLAVALAGCTSAPPAAPGNEHYDLVKSLNVYM